MERIIQSHIYICKNYIPGTVLDNGAADVVGSVEELAVVYINFCIHTDTITDTNRKHIYIYMSTPTNTQTTYLVLLVLLKNSLLLIYTILYIQIQ